jgi:outer membrane lipoprotein SlyB
MNPKLITVAGLLVAFGAGCTFPSGSRVVSRKQAGQIQRIEYGTVEKVSDVVIEGERTQIGLYGGGLTGAAAGGGVGHGTGRDLARAGGAVAGAVAGQAVEEAVTRKAALEMIIKLDSGSTVVLTEETLPAVVVGDRVGVASGPGGSRLLLP